MLPPTHLVRPKKIIPPPEVSAVTGVGVVLGVAVRR